MLVVFMSLVSFNVCGGQPRRRHRAKGMATTSQSSLCGIWKLGSGVRSMRSCLLLSFWKQVDSRRNIGASTRMMFRILPESTSIITEEVYRTVIKSGQFPKVMTLSERVMTRAALMTRFLAMATMLSVNDDYQNSTRGRTYQTLSSQLSRSLLKPSCARNPYDAETSGNLLCSTGR